jgi:integrase
MANSLTKQTQGDAMNIPPGIDRLPTEDGSSRYRVRIRIKGHKPVSKNFKSLTHAKQWKRVTEGQIEKGLYVSYSKADRHTLTDAIERYEKEILPHKPKDFKNASRHLLRWKKELGHLKLSRLNQSAIAEVRDRMLTEMTTNGKLRSNGTVNRYLASLSPVFSIAVREWQWMSENPCLKVKKLRESRGRLRYLSREELARLLKACKESENPHLHLIFLIALTTGARKSEILGLTGQHIDLENRLLYLADTKNGDNRSVPMSDQIFEILKEHPIQKDLLLFPSKDPTVPLCIRSAWLVAVQKAELIDFRFHDVRHTTASYLTMSGISTREVAEMLGHKSLQTTARYSHLANEHKRTLVNRLEEMLHEKPR